MFLSVPLFSELIKKKQISGFLCYEIICDGDMDIFPGSITLPHKNSSQFLRLYLTDCKIKLWETSCTNSYLNN